MPSFATSLVSSVVDRPSRACVRAIDFDTSSPRPYCQRDARPSFSGNRGATWACDFRQTCDLLFRQVYAFFIVYLGSRRVVYAAACRHPTQEWTTQQLRNATMDGEAPKIVLRDRDDKYGTSFDRAAKGVGTRVIKTAVRAPNANAVA